jgi:uncharacterized protein
VTDTPAPAKVLRGRGFAGMDPDRLREIASKGGKSVDPAKRSFSKDNGLAVAAGRKGGNGGAGKPKKSV